MRKYRLVLFSSLFFFGFALNAQDQNATITFKDGSRMVGGLHQMDPDSIWIDSEIHGLRSYSRADVVSFIFGEERDVVKSEFYRQDYQVALEASIMINRDHLSPAIQLVALKKMSKLVYAGIGTGVNFFDYDRDEISYPVFVSGKLYLRERVVSPFIQLNLGYAFGQSSEDFGISNVDGGMMYNPRVGVEFGSQHVSANIFAGMKFQELAYDFLVWNGELRETKNYRRFEIGASFIF
jgi:hypothetical protein